MKARKKVDWRKVPVTIDLKVGDTITLHGPIKVRGCIYVGAMGSVEVVARIGAQELFTNDKSKTAVRA